MSTVAPSEIRTGDAVEHGAGLQRYNFFERIVHWTVAISFIALMLSARSTVPALVQPCALVHHPTVEQIIQCPCLVHQ